MQKLQRLYPGNTYKIVQHGNGDDPIFFEYANRPYFRKLLRHHLSSVCRIVQIRLDKHRIELILKFFNVEEIPEKYRDRLHQPLSNLLNSYAKAINKRYDRKGSLFRVRFERRQIHGKYFDVPSNKFLDI